MTKNQFKDVFERRIASLSPENRARVIKEATDDATFLSYLSPVQLELLQAIFEKDEEEKIPVTLDKNPKIECLVKLDPIVEAVRAKLHQRSQVGIEKYKTTLEDSNLTERQILIHAQEEALDLANYLEYRIQQIDKGTSDYIAAVINDLEIAPIDSKVCAVNLVFELGMNDLEVFEMLEKLGYERARYDHQENPEGHVWIRTKLQTQENTPCNSQPL